MESLIHWGLGVAVPVAVAAFLKFYPKSKAIDAGGKLGDIVGAAISAFGNSKIGRKTWSRIEEGPIVTFFAFCMAFITRAGNRMLADNYEEVSNASVQPSESKETK